MATKRTVDGSKAGGAPRSAGTPRAARADKPAEKRAAPAKKAAPGARARSSDGEAPAARRTTARDATTKAAKAGRATRATGPSERPKLRSSHGAAASRPTSTDRAPAMRERRAPRPALEAPSAPLDVEASSPGSRQAELPVEPTTKRAKATTGRKTAPLAPPAQPSPSPRSREAALAIAAAGMDKKAAGIEIIDLTGRVDYADFLVLMTGRSDRHVYAIASGIDEAMTQRKEPPHSVEGLERSQWVLLDFGDVVVHVFQEDTRQLYDLEGLWMDARRIPPPVDGPPAPGGAGPAKS